MKSPLSILLRIEPRGLGAYRKGLWKVDIISIEQLLTLKD